MAPKIPKPDKPVYLHHPIANADVVKLEVRKLGYQILDEQFAPPDYKIPSAIQAILDDAGAYAEPDDAAESATGPAQPDSGAPATTAPASGDDPAAAEAAAKAAAEKAQQEQADKDAAEKAAKDKADKEAADKEAAEKAEAERKAKEAAGGKKAPADMTDQELRDAIEKKTGSKPAWNAKRDTLLAALGE